MSIPQISKTFFCIAGRKDFKLAAIVCSYTNTKGEYTPFFEFPLVTAANKDIDGLPEDENTFSISRAQQFATDLHNVIARGISPENIILIGLDEDQKSYLDFPAISNVIDINTSEDANFILGSFFLEPRPMLQCREEQLLPALFIALRRGAIIRIEETAEEIVMPLLENTGLIVIENASVTTTIIAINYAFSINADIRLIEQHPPKTENTVQILVNEWRNGSKSAFQELEFIILSRIDSIDWCQFNWVTFFTIGIPYTMFGIPIPSSYVSTHANADLFIMRNLIAHYSRKTYGASVIFSPGFFKEKEEIASVKAKFVTNNFHVQEYIGDMAILTNLDMSLKEFPYEMYHICSHGGQLTGSLVETDFVDSNGIKHTIEYEEAVSFFGGMRPDIIGVQQTIFPKKMDRYAWGSDDLKKPPYTHKIAVEFYEAARNKPAVEKKILIQKKKISNSGSIECKDAHYQPLIDMLAAQTYPVIFNNSCSSGLALVNQFIHAGARGYIGTIWEVDNQAAVSFAETYYATCFSNSAMKSAYLAGKSISGTESENIYMVWGLHFSNIRKQEDQIQSRSSTFRVMHSSQVQWNRQLSTINDQKTKEKIEDKIKWLRFELGRTFSESEGKQIIAEFLSRKNNR